MSKRRRWLLGFALALVAGGVVVWRILAPGGRMEVQLIFLGYTNVPVLPQPAFLPPGSEVLEVPQALLCATNTGSVPVELWSSFRSPNLSNTTQFAYPSGRGLPAVLKPGKSMTVEVWPMNNLRWRTEFMYQRHNLADRLYKKGWNSGNVTIQAWMRDLLPAPETGWAESDWITSPPPEVPAPPVFRWTKAPTLLEGSIRWDSRGTYRDDRPVSKNPDFIDASRPQSRYHITAPPDTGNIDLSDLTKQ